MYYDDDCAPTREDERQALEAENALLKNQVSALQNPCKADNNQTLEVLKEVARASCYKCKQGHEPVLYGCDHWRWMHPRTYTCATSNIPGDHCNAMPIWDKIKELGGDILKWDPLTGRSVPNE